LEDEDITSESDVDQAQLQPLKKPKVEFDQGKNKEEIEKLDNEI